MKVAILFLSSLKYIPERINRKMLQLCFAECHRYGSLCHWVLKLWMLQRDTIVCYHREFQLH